MVLMVCVVFAVDLMVNFNGVDLTDGLTGCPTCADFTVVLDCFAGVVEYLNNLASTGFLRYLLAQSL